MFLTYLRRASILVVSACAYMVSVDSPLSPNSISFPSSSVFSLHNIVLPFFSPLAHGNTTFVKRLPLFTLDEPPPMIDTSSLRPGVSSPFAIDFTDIDIHVLEILVPAVRAVARAIRSDSVGVGDSIVLEALKVVLILGGFKAQGGLGMGDAVDKLDKILTSTILRFAVELVLGTLAALFARLHLRPFRMRISREMDAWVTRQLHCAVLLTIIHLRPAVFQAVSDGILAAAALAMIPSMSAMLATVSSLISRPSIPTPLKSADDSYAPAPPLPGRRKKKRWY
ncbi:hypothetical protein B0H17DRAFT_1218205 [Mycena rosella]|uniref:Uncharacterized protein n=1 Tax=Mycena rosella TaxID=1033263 RepID=A0AAD7BSG0_MYCRO|nr:hypothetical protein B0H17DRAFT_1218205 [Mycena rosella]